MDDVTRRAALAATVGGAAAMTLGAGGSAKAQEEKPKQKAVRKADYQHQASAVALISARMAHDPAFAEEFEKLSAGGDHKALREFMTKAGVSSDTEVVVIPGGVCICRGSYCVCIIIRKT